VAKSTEGNRSQRWISHCTLGVHASMSAQSAPLRKIAAELCCAMRLIPRIQAAAKFTVTQLLAERRPRSVYSPWQPAARQVKPRPLAAPGL
jgi:hypothetical protein